jgi:hypothetical protein
MSLEPACRIIRVDIKSERLQPRNIRPEEPASERQYKAVIRDPGFAACIIHRDRLRGAIDAGHATFDPPHADRRENIIQRNDDVGQIALVIPDADVVIWILIDQDDLGIPWRDSELQKLAHRADRAPQPGKSTTQNKDTLHVGTR